MNHHAPHRRSGSYTANLLGNIKSHLAGLQGYDVMALELIQNADDAGAEAVEVERPPPPTYPGTSGALEAFAGNGTRGPRVEAFRQDGINH